MFLRGEIDSGAGKFDRLMGGVEDLWVEKGCVEVGECAVGQLGRVWCGEAGEDVEAFEVVER